MRPTLALALMMAACGDDWHGVYANGEPFAECAPPPARPACSGSGRSFALAVCGDLEANNTLNVNGGGAEAALWVAGSAVTRAPLTVQGALWSASFTATNTVDVDSQRAGVAPPSCAPVPAVRSETRWDVRIVEPAEVMLQGCSFAQPSLQVDNTLDVYVRGDVSWHIDGDVRIAAPLRVVLEPGARLDWTITGALDVDNTLTVEGDSTMLVGGRIRVAAPFELDGSLIAPGSRVEVDNTLTITGAAYVGALRVAAPMRVGGETLLHEDGC
ncbi:MAG: hypothetical protein ABW352_15265 [Polyangiales bacterium]